MKTTIDQNRYKTALYRNLNEAGMAILERRAMVGIDGARTNHAMDFVRIAYDAMFNDMIAHAIKLFEKNTQVASFWYIKRCKEKEVSDFVINNRIDILQLEKIGDSLKHIRDKTHFHVDKDAVKNPKAVWDKAKIKGRELAEAVDNAYRILDHLYFLENGAKFRIPKYTGSDAAKIAKYASTL